MPCSFRIQGKVVDVEGNALPGANVFISETNAGTATDNEGNFVLNNLCQASYTLSISFLGYTTLTQRIKLRKSETITLRLVADETLLSEVVVQDHYDHISKAQTSTALSGAALDATRGKALGEALKSITGVNTIQAGPAIFKPVIHGVHSQRILILNNGIRHEGQQWGAEHAPEIDPFLASNIVVIKDASAIKYGTDALGGVVIVNPGALPTAPGVGGNFNTRVQSNGRGITFSGIVEGAAEKIKGLSWRTHGTLRKGGDFETPTYVLTNTGFEERNFSAAASYHKTEASGFEFFYSHFNSTIGILKGSSVSSPENLLVAFESERPQFTTNFSYGIESPKQEVSHDLMKANAHFHRGENTLSLQYALQINQRKEFDLRRSMLNDLPAIDLTLYTHTLDIEWEKESNESSIRCIGINAMIQDNNNNPGTQRLPFIPNFNNYSGGVYAIQKKVWEQWEVEAGLRFDYRYYTVAGRDYSNSVYKSSLTFANASATLGATRTITKRSSFTSGLSTAWRPPHVAELYSIGTHQSAAAIEYGLLLDETTNRVRDIGTIDFKNEKAVKWVNTYRRKAIHSQVEMSGYVNYIFNYIYLKPEGVTQDVRGAYPYFRYRQTNAAFAGIDARIDQQLSPIISAIGKASLLWTKDISNNDALIYMPSNRADLLIRYQRDLGIRVRDFFIETGVNYVARQNNGPRVISIRELLNAGNAGIDLFENDTRAFDFIEVPDAYWLASASMGLSLKTKKQKMDIRAACENLFDRSYREYTNRMRYFSDEVGRNISISIKYSF